MDEAVKLFSQTDSIDTVIMAPYETYLEKLKVCVDRLLSITPVVESVDSLESEEDIKEFIVAFRELAKVLVSLKTFNQFDLDTCGILINTQIFEDYKSKYYELYRKLSNDKEKSSILNDVTFSLELIQTKLVNITDDELFLKADLIKSFLTSILPTLKEDDSIDEALDNHMNKEREKEIEKFASNNEINLDRLKQIIDEYEYSGIFPDKEINDSIEIDDYWERRTIKNNIKEFIKNILKKFM